MSAQHVVVLGGGHAGFHVALFLRMRGFDGRVTIVDGQASLPYQRPPLSKEYLHGKQELVDTHFRPASFYQEHQIELLTGAEARNIDRQARTVELSGGQRLVYDRLVLATGSRPRNLAVPGSDLDGVLHLAVADDAVRVRERIQAADRVCIVGGGFIGLETAAAAAAAGKQVTVLEAADRLMGRAVSPPMSNFFAGLHRSRGVDIRLSSAVAGIEGVDGAASAVRLAADDAVATDLVVVGVGALPRHELAHACGLAVDGGVVVGPDLRTSDPAIFAIGDCVRFATQFSHGSATVRLESVQNATDQAKFVATCILDEGGAAFYDCVPWFWTEQFGHKLQIAGLIAGADRFEEVRTSDEKFSIYSYIGDTMIGCESVNSPGDHVRARKTLGQALAARTR